MSQDGDEVWNQVNGTESVHGDRESNSFGVPRRSGVSARDVKRDNIPFDVPRPLFTAHVQFYGRRINGVPS